MARAHSDISPSRRSSLNWGSSIFSGQSSARPSPYRTRDRWSRSCGVRQSTEHAICIVWWHKLPCHPSHHKNSCLPEASWRIEHGWEDGKWTTCDLANSTTQWSAHCWPGRKMDQTSPHGRTCHTFQTLSRVYGHNVNIYRYTVVCCSEGHTQIQMGEPDSNSWSLKTSDMKYSNTSTSTALVVTWVSKRPRTRLLSPSSGLVFNKSWRNCRRCDSCAACKPPLKRPRAPLQQYLVGNPMERIADDILGPLPKTRQGKSFVVVLGDYFTKWMEAFSIPNQETQTVTRVVVEQLICRFGVPRRLHTDRDSNFQSALFQQVLDWLDCICLTMTHLRQDILAVLHK